MKRGSNAVLSLLFVAIYLLLGLFLVMNPEPSVKIICGMIGGILGVLGVARIINYFKLDRYEAMLRKELANGMFFLLIAFYVIMKASTIVGIIPIFLGILLVYEGMSLLQHTLDLVRAHIKQWVVNLVAGVITLALGVVSLFDPFKTGVALMRFIGIAYIVAAVAVVVSMVLMRIFKKEYEKSKQEIVPAEEKK